MLTFLMASGIDCSAHTAVHAMPALLEWLLCVSLWLEALKSKLRYAPPCSDWSSLFPLFPWPSPARHMLIGCCCCYCLCYRHGVAGSSPALPFPFDDCCWCGLCNTDVGLRMALPSIQTYPIFTGTVEFCSSCCSVWHMLAFCLSWIKINIFLLTILFSDYGRHKIITVQNKIVWLL